MRVPPARPGDAGSLQQDASDAGVAQTFLLTFHDHVRGNSGIALEHAFWTCGSVRRNLCLVDQVSGAVVIFNNIFLRIIFVASGDRRLIYWHQVWAGACVVASLG